MWILRSWLAALCVAFVIAVPAEAQTCQSLPPPGVAPTPLALTPVTLQILQPVLDSGSGHRRFHPPRFCGADDQS